MATEPRRYGRANPVALRGLAESVQRRLERELRAICPRCTAHPRRLRAWAAVIFMPPGRQANPLDDVISAVMQCEVCQATVADELDSYEVIVREVRRRNAPATHLRVCKRCALAIAHVIERRVEVLRTSPRET